MESLHVTKMDDTLEFVKESSIKLEWGDLAGAEYVMDIGCGNGFGSTDALIKAFPQIRRVIAIDINEEDDKFESAKVQYRIANIEDRASLTSWNGMITHALSVSCFNCLQDPRSALENLHYLLAPNGTAAIHFPIENPFNTWYNKVMTQVLKPDQIMRFPKEVLTAEYFEKLAREAGFQVITCEAIARKLYFKSDEECLHFLWICCNLVETDEATLVLKKRFEKFLLDTFSNYCTYDEEKRRELRITRLKLLLKKPASK